MLSIQLHNDKLLVTLSLQQLTVTFADEDKKYDDFHRL